MDFTSQSHTQSAELDLLIGEADQTKTLVVVTSSEARDEDPTEQLDRQILAGLVSF